MKMLSPGLKISCTERSSRKIGALFPGCPPFPRLIKFDMLSRLQITIAKIQQSLPELKRDGSTVLSSLWADVVHDETSSSRLGGILPQIDFIPAIARMIQEEPEKVISDFEEIRKHSEQLATTCVHATIISIFASHGSLRSSVFRNRKHPFR